MAPLAGEDPSARCRRGGDLGLDCWKRSGISGNSASINFFEQWDRVRAYANRTACRSSGIFRSTSRWTARTCGSTGSCSSWMSSTAHLRGWRSAGCVFRDGPAVGQSTLRLGRDGTHGFCLVESAHGAFRPLVRRDPNRSLSSAPCGIMPSPMERQPLRWASGGRGPA